MRLILFRIAMVLIICQFFCPLSVFAESILNSTSLDKTFNISTYDIEKNLLPEGAHIVNEPDSIWESESRIAITLMVLLIGYITVVIGINIFFDKHRKQQELLRKEANISEVKERLERIIDTAPVSYLLLIDGKVVEMNEAMKKEMGLNIGDDVQKVYADPSQRVATIERLLRQGRLTNEIIRFNIANGENHRCLLNAAITEYEQQQAIVVWSVDIEQEEAKKDQLEMAQQSLQTLLDTLPVPVRILDLESRTVTYANKRCLNLFECYSYKEMYGRHISEMLPVCQSDGTSSAKKEEYIMNTEEPFSLEIEYLSAKGKIIDSLLTAFKIDYHGKKSSVGVIRDLAEERREAQLHRAALAAEAASQAKSTFIAHMSHEIRTPMNSIIGFSNLALEGDVSPKIRDYLQKIKVSSEVLLQMTNDILDISKIESGKMELKNNPFDMQEVFKVCQTIISQKASEKGISLYCYTEPSLGKKLLGDSNRLLQVLLNLLSNAVKFTNDGSVELLSTIENTTEDSVTIRFEVKDSGIGISPEQFETIFEPFVQADESATRQYDGTGLGLPIAKNIIAFMGGTLNLESIPDVGSKFYFTLTFKTIDTPADFQNREEIVAAPLKMPVFKGEVLLCEDNALNQQVVCEHLSKVGLKVVIAVNGKEGVKQVASRLTKGEKPFDLIFMDMHMPVMDGLEAAKKLTLIGNTTPIVVLSANVMSDDWNNYQAYGIVDQMSKPFKPRELWDCLLKYITPVDLKTAEKESPADEKLRRRLLTNFAKDNQTTFKDLTNAILAGDITLAHRLAHTLKGTAGLIGKIKLANAAGAIEYSLKNGKVEFTTEQLKKFELELEEVLDELAPYLNESNSQSPRTETLDKAKALEILEKLELLLKSNSFNCLDFTEDLRAIPGTESLIEQIEEFDFTSASESIAGVKQFLGGVVNEQ